MLRIIISAPHAQNSIQNKKLRKRFRLSDHEIWKCSDPFTDHLAEFTCARYKLTGKTHRLICDLNRPPNNRAFHEKDFFGRKVFKNGQKFSAVEKKEHLKKFWLPYHERLEKKILELDKKSPKPILVIEYHNTSGDHPLRTHSAYMPGMVISNLGATDTGIKTSRYPHTSLPPKHLKFLQKEIKKDLAIPVEINEIYHGGYNTLWVSQISKRHKTRAKIYCVQIEYNLDFVANPISRKIDHQALKQMQKALNKALVALYRTL